MDDSNKKSLIPLLLVLCIAIIGFKDTGIFLSDFMVNKIKFTKGEEVSIVDESKVAYLVAKQGEEHQVPKTQILKNPKSDYLYKVINKTEIKRELNGQVLRNLKPNDEVTAVYLDESHGIFKLEDGTKGYINLKDLKKLEVENKAVATAKVNKIIENNGKSFALVRGNKVDIKDLSGDYYIIVDGKGNEFPVLEQDLIIGNVQDETSRGRSTKDIGNHGNKVEKLVAAAHKELGKPYVSGDIGRVGYDCSGLTYSLYYNTLGIKLPRDSRGQATAGKHVNKSDLVAGDLVFFRTSGQNIGHVGIYIGNNNMIHASTGQRKMMITDIDTNYFAKRYVTARRILN